LTAQTNIFEINIYIHFDTTSDVNFKIIENGGSIIPGVVNKKYSLYSFYRFWKFLAAFTKKKQALAK
jgi:hypothetical protein